MLSHKIEHLRNKMKVHEDFKAPPVVVQVVGENLVSDGDIDYSCIFPKGTPETGTSICMQEWELSKDATRILIRSYSSLGGHSTDVKHGDRWDRYKAKLMLNHRLCTDFIVLDTFEDID